MSTEVLQITMAWERKRKQAEADLRDQLNEAEDRDAWQKCAGCLMVLAANSQQVKHLVGDEDGIRALCEIDARTGAAPGLGEAAEIVEKDPDLQAVSQRERSRAPSFPGHASASSPREVLRSPRLRRSSASRDRGGP